MLTVGPLDVSKNEMIVTTWVSQIKTNLKEEEETNNNVFINHNM